VTAAVGAVPIPHDLNVSTEYPVAILSDAPAQESARLFISYLLTGPAQARLLELGFGTP